MGWTFKESKFDSRRRQMNYLFSTAFKTGRGAQAAPY
jgi:hypothetical protein